MVLYRDHLIDWLEPIEAQTLQLLFTLPLIEFTLGPQEVIVDNHLLFFALVKEYIVK